MDTARPKTMPPTTDEGPISSPRGLSAAGNGNSESLETVARPVCRCKRCPHVWIARSNKLPGTCPLCRSPFWNQDKLTDRRRPYVARCPLCSWAVPYRTEETAALGVRRHIRESHGEEELERVKHSAV